MVKQTTSLLFFALFALSFVTVVHSQTYFCESGNFLNTTSKACAACGSGMLSCVNATVAIECKDGFYKLTNNSCAACAGCLRCNGNTSANCLDNAPVQGQAINATGTATAAISCPANCSQCDSSKCYVCSPGYFPTVASGAVTCTTPCSIANCVSCPTSASTCSACVLGAFATLTSGAITGCTLCNASDSKATNCTAANKATACVSGYTVVSDVCTACTDPNAISCSSANKSVSTQCKNGTGYDNYTTSCLSCKLDNCQNCTITKDSATAQTYTATCTVCPPGYTLSNGNCTACTGANCADCTIPTGTTSQICKRCVRGYYADSAGVCQACDSSCATCSAIGNESCTSCPNTAFLWATMIITSQVSSNAYNATPNAYKGKCLTISSTVNCSAQVTNTTGVTSNKYFNRCSACPANCKNCTNPLTCEQCRIGYFVNATQNQANQLLAAMSTLTSTTPTYVSIATGVTTPCVACPSGCSDCASATQCQRCPQGQSLVNGTCSSSCPAGTFSNSVNITVDNSLVAMEFSNTQNPNATNGTGSTQPPPSASGTTSATQTQPNATCSSCDSICGTCATNSSMCTSCKIGYFLANNTCNACSSSCSNCTSAKNCMACSDTFYLTETINGTEKSTACNAACPTGMITFAPMGNTSTTATTGTNQSTNGTTATQTNTTAPQGNTTANAAMNASITALNTALKAIDPTAFVPTPYPTDGIMAPRCVPCRINCTVCVSWTSLITLGTNSACLDKCPLGYTSTLVAGSSPSAYTCQQSANLAGQIIRANRNDTSADLFNPVIYNTTVNTKSGETITYTWSVTTATVNSSVLFASVSTGSGSLIIPAVNLATFSGQTINLQLLISSSSRGNLTLTTSFTVSSSLPPVGLQVKPVNSSDAATGAAFQFSLANNGNTTSNDVKVYILDNNAVNFYLNSGFLKNSTGGTNVTGFVETGTSNAPGSGTARTWFESMYDCTGMDPCNKSFLMPNPRETTTYQVIVAVQNNKMKMRSVTFSNFTVMPQTITGNVTVDPSRMQGASGNDVKNLASSLLGNKNITLGGTAPTGNTTQQGQQGQQGGMNGTITGNMTGGINGSMGGNGTQGPIQNNTTGGANTNGGQGQTGGSTTQKVTSVTGSSCTLSSKCNNVGCIPAKQDPNVPFRCDCTVGYVGPDCGQNAATLAAQNQLVSNLTTMLKGADCAGTACSQAVRAICDANVTMDSSNVKSLGTTILSAAQANGQVDDTTRQALGSLMQQGRISSQSGMDVGMSALAGNSTTQAASVNQQAMKNMLSLYSTVDSVNSLMAKAAASTLTAGQQQTASSTGLINVVAKINWGSTSSSTGSPAGTTSGTTGGTGTQTGTQGGDKPAPTFSSAVTATVSIPGAESVDTISTTATSSRLLDDSSSQAMVGLTSEVQGKLSDPNSVFAFSASSNSIAGLLDNTAIVTSSAVYSVGFTSSSGDSVPVQNLKTPVPLCIPIKSSITTAQAQKLSWSCGYLDTSSNTLDWTIKVDTSQISKGFVCCQLTHFSSYTVTGSTATSHAAALGTTLTALLAVVMAFIFA